MMRRMKLAYVKLRDEKLKEIESENEFVKEIYI